MKKFSFIKELGLFLVGFILGVFIMHFSILLLGFWLGVVTGYILCICTGLLMARAYLYFEGLL